MLYQLRHSGASSDLFSRRRELGEVFARGRWDSPQRVRRYGKPGQAQAYFNRLDEEVRGFCEWIFSTSKT